MSSTRNDRFMLLASGARTATSTGTTAVVDMGGYAAMLFELDVTAAATEVDDTLDVFIQTVIGNDWVDIVHFTQVLGNGSAKRYFGKVSAAEPMTMFENATALGAAAVRNMMGDSYRVRYAIVDPGGSAVSFTFSVVATGVSQ